ncbi:MAG TPA: sodium:proton antiporter [Candidatus Krumholzibacteria bacterium]|nr:sodium:proton antiporter [Candidatus Krumholzibacteria bacterium]
MSHDLGTLLPAWWTIPFAGMLLSIALFPLVAPRFWHHHYPKVALFWGLVLAVPFLFIHRGQAVHHLLETILAEYIPFLVILWALYTVASGIVVTGSLRGTPLQNMLIIAIGGAVASWIGTTGASIVLIRPLIRAISWRKHRAHTIVAFIFVVSNAGGLLTPIGDPPLFLGFLHGVPFFWTLHLLPEMLTVILPILGLYYFFDRRYYRREEQRESTGESRRPGIAGGQNLLLLLGIVASVVASGAIHLGSLNILGVENDVAGLFRDLALIGIGLISLKITPHTLHQENQFSWGPIKEVAILFAGIFVTMIPAIAILRAGEEGALRGVISMAHEPKNYFWLTGMLSSFLDNAPTYLTFLNTALGALEPGKIEAEAMHHLLTTHAHFLQAISCGAVFMGANTYIGNAPNFMVKSIAEEAGIEMPSFFGYMIKYSIPVLIPLFLLVTFISFR